MKQVENNNNSALEGIRNAFTDFLNKSEVFHALARPWAPMGGNYLEAGHDVHKNDHLQNLEDAENRYSVLYTLNTQYHHVGCASQSEAQEVLSQLMTDEKRIPIGIYDGKEESFEWEVIGQYFHSRDSLSEQQDRLEEVLSVSKALRRRDGSWMPGYMQRPSLFA